MNDSYKATFAAKWSEDVAQRGFVPVPKCLITCMGELGLTPQELAVLLNIMEKCWFAGDKSWQKVDTIAANIGRKNSATRGITRSLAKKGFITKTPRYNMSNLYDLAATAQELDEHIKYCRHTAKNLSTDSQESSGQDSQNLSDYIEPVLTRTNNIKPNTISRSFIKNENNDTVSVNFNYIKTNKKCLLSTNGKHEWREYSIDKRISDSEDAIYFYFVCKNCHKQFHKKNDYPWNAEYPHYQFDEEEDEVYYE